MREFFNKLLQQCIPADPFQPSEWNAARARASRLLTPNPARQKIQGLWKRNGFSISACHSVVVSPKYIITLEVKTVVLWLSSDKATCPTIPTLDHRLGQIIQMKPSTTSRNSELDFVTSRNDSYYLLGFCSLCSSRVLFMSTTHFNSPSHRAQCIFQAGAVILPLSHHAGICCVFWPNVLLIFSIRFKPSFVVHACFSPAISSLSQTPLPH